MRLREMIDRLRTRLGGENGIRLIVLLGLAGMALILLSGLLPDAKPKQSEPELQCAEAGDNPDADSYRQMLEQRLTELLSQMEGVGQVTVMITVSGSAEQVYAEEVKTSSSDHNTQRESVYVITKQGGDEAALRSETKYPAVQGAAVLCSGGDHAAVQERISKAVSTVLGIPAARIFVGKSAAG